MEQIRLDDLRTGDQIRVTTANSTYQMRIVAAEFRLAEVGGHLVSLYGNPVRERYESAAIDVGHEFQWTTVTPPGQRREASVRVITTSAVVSIEITPRTRPDWGVRAVAACRRLRLIAAVTIRHDERRATAVAVAERRREEAVRAALLAEIASLGEPPSEERSITELRELRDKLVANAAARAEEQAKIGRVDQEREREIHRLEVELGSLPVEASLNEDHAARRSWELLQQALATPEPRRRVELLKEARRVLPREYRPERF